MPPLSQRGRMERIDLAGSPSAKTDMRAAFMRYLAHVLAQIDPEFRIVFAEADRGRPRHQSRQPECGERGLIEACGTLEIGDADGDVIDHEGMIRKSVKRFSDKIMPKTRR